MISQTMGTMGQHHEHSLSSQTLLSGGVDQLAELVRLKNRALCTSNILARSGQ